MIKIYDENDSDMIFDLERQIFFNNSYELSQIEDMLSKPKFYKILSLKDDNTIIRAYVIVFNNSESLEILKVGVELKYRKLGLGTILIDEVKKLGMDIFLEVRENNYAAINFYKLNGFKEIGKRKNYYTDTKEAAILMVFKFNS